MSSEPNYHIAYNELHKAEYLYTRSLKWYYDTEMYPGFQIMGSSGPRLEKFGGPLLTFGVQLIYSQQD